MSFAITVRTEPFDELGHFFVPDEPVVCPPIFICDHCCEMCPTQETLDLHTLEHHPPEPHTDQK